MSYIILYLVLLGGSMLNLAEDIKPISYIKAHTADVLKQIDDRKNPLVITQNGEAKAVLLDIYTYQSLIDGISLMKIISIGENQIAAGKTITNDELDKKIQELLK
jgi:prevent-host-death family protein